MMDNHYKDLKKKFPSLFAHKKDLTNKTKILGDLMADWKSEGKELDLKAYLSKFNGMPRTLKNGKVILPFSS